MQELGGGGVSESSMRKSPLAWRAIPAGLDRWAVAAAGGPQNRTATTLCPPLVPIPLPPASSNPRPWTSMRPLTSTWARSPAMRQGTPPGLVPRTTLRTGAPALMPDTGSTPMPWAQLNEAVENGHRDVADVAREFLATL